MSIQQFGIAYCLTLIGLLLFGMWIERRITRKRRWPQGHNHASYWGSAKRVNDQ